jgi:hypothetical protein
VPGCETTCGDVDVPYPFGFGPGWCYLPGFDLTCDKGHNPPRLLLGGGNSTFQVLGIFLNDSTVRVVHATTFDVAFLQLVGVRFPDIGGPYMLSARNEVILTGCNVEATLHNATGNSIVSCVSNCTSSVIGGYPTHKGNNDYCSGRDSCCHVPIPPRRCITPPATVSSAASPTVPPASSADILRTRAIMTTARAEMAAAMCPSRLAAGPTESQSPLNITRQDILDYYALAFVAEEGQIDQWYMIFNRSSDAYSLAYESYIACKVPLVLRWVVEQNLSTSAQSDCQREDNGGYTCHCRKASMGTLASLTDAKVGIY